MPHLSERLADAITERALDLSRFDGHVRRRVLGRLRRLEQELAEQIQEADLGNITMAHARRRRTEKLIADARATIAAHSRGARDVHLTELRSLASLEAAELVLLTNEAIGLDLMRVTLSENELAALAHDNVILGGPAKDWWLGQSQRSQQRFATQIRLGVMQGETNDELVRRIRGRATGRRIRLEINGLLQSVPEFRGGVMDVTTNEAKRLVRTSVQAVGNETHRRIYEGNDDLIRGFQAVTTLDTRISEICIARTGGAWDLEGKPLPESTIQAPFPGWPPWHWNCRTVLIAVLKSWKQLISEANLGKRQMQKLETAPADVVASMDGQIQNPRTFDAFLAWKGDTWAARKLGPTRFDLWKRGKITTAQLIDQTGRPASIEQLSKVKRASRRPVPAA